MTQSLPVIFGCSGPELTPEEERFFREVRPCGFIVFRRNCVSREQLRRLATQLRATIDDAHAPIQIDQEGGRVLRLRAPEWWEAPAAGAIGSAYDGDQERAVRAAELVGRIIGLQLSDVGVTVDCAPCVDLRYPFGHSVIGDRAFHADPKAVTRLGRAFADGLASAGVQATIKHLPGHGRALVLLLDPESPVNKD